MRHQQEVRGWKRVKSVVFISFYLFPARPMFLLKALMYPFFLSFVLPLPRYPFSSGLAMTPYYCCPQRIVLSLVVFPKSYPNLCVSPFIKLNPVQLCVICCKDFDTFILKKNGNVEQGFYDLGTINIFVWIILCCQGLSCTV